MPVEPPPTRFRFPAPSSAGEDDLVAVGGDLEPGTVLAAYRSGLFPMNVPDGRLGWWSPVRRGVLPLDKMKVSRSLHKSYRRYRYTVDAEAESVVAACADPSRPHGWITPEISAAYLRLHKMGWVHSVEVWTKTGELAGGLYGVGIGGLFAGESMFTLGRDASKCALLYLVELLRQGGATLLDSQWATPHLQSLGVIEMARADYLVRLRDALIHPGPWGLDDR